MSEEYKDGLRIIKTLRSFNEKTINSFIQKGYRPLIRKVEQRFLDCMIIIQDKKTEEIHLIGSHPQTYERLEESHRIRMATQFDTEDCDEFRYKVLERISFYPYDLGDPRYPYAAYLIPPDVKPNEKVFIIDLIEELNGGRGRSAYNFDIYKRLESCKAIWDGEELKILYESPKSS